MSSAKVMSDAELRSQLKEFGVSVGPITGTTRAIYIKRLKRLKLCGVAQKSTASQKSLNDHPTSSLCNVTLVDSLAYHKTIGFSSDESDNNEVPRKLNKQSTSFRTQTLRRKANGVGARSSKLQHSDDDCRLTQNKGTPSSSHSKSGYSDDSGDSDELNEEKCRQSTSAECRTPSGLLGSPEVIVSKLRIGQSSLYSSTEQPTMISSCERANVGSMQDQSNVSMSTQGVFANSFQVYDPISQTVPKESRNGNTVFRRKPQSNRQAVLIDDAISKVSTRTNRLALPKLSLFSKVCSRFFYKKTDNLEATSFVLSESTSPRAWSLHCSVLLPVLTAVFFVMLGLLYVTMGSDDMSSNLGPSSLDFNSLEVKDDERETFVVVNHIYTILATAAGNALCKISNDDSKLHIDRLKLELKVDTMQLFKALDLTRRHPEWGVFLYKDKLGADVGIEDDLSAIHFLETKHAILSTQCRLQRAATKVMYHLAIILLALFVMWLMLLCLRYLQRKKEERRQKMLAMADKILDVLKNQYVTSCIDDKVEPSIPIRHVRDMVIPPKDRRSKSKEWERAVHFISTNEFHVKVETEKIDGEDCNVWRWAQVSFPSKRQLAQCRVWQGGALVNNLSKNVPNISPTPCLKIRNMFDPDLEKDVDWQLQIQESILEKCSDNNGILSIVVEKRSREGLVYVKCLSCFAAGKAFQSLQGSWFDGRLVTVKFIKLQRFHTRFPYTVDLKTPLKPNSKNPVSTLPPSELNSSGFLTPASFISDF